MWSAWIGKRHSIIEIILFTGFWVQSIHRHVFDENGCSYNYGAHGLKIYCILTGMHFDARRETECNDILQSLGIHLVSINVYAKFHHNIQLSSRDRAIFTFQNMELGKALTDDNVISQFLVIDLVNINVYANVYLKIPNGLRVIDIFTFCPKCLGTKSSQTVRWQNQMSDYRAHSEIQPSATVDFLRAVRCRVCINWHY